MTNRHWPRTTTARPQLGCLIVPTRRISKPAWPHWRPGWERSSSRSSTAQTDASAARELAAGADRDVSEVRAELRAHTRALNALRETQVEQGQAMDRGFAEMRARLDQTTGGLDQILGVLNTPITRDDKS